MNALDILQKISENEKLLSAELRYCYITQDKVPFNGTLPAKPNNPADFLSFDELDLSLAASYAGLGISIQASGICAIDVDHCFKIPFDRTSQDERAENIINLFCNHTYIEFSFSGTGLRILFYANVVPDYSKQYYIKNSRTQCEYYYPESSYRYVTITGQTICANEINHISDNLLAEFLNLYMKKPVAIAQAIMFTPCIYKDPLIHFLRTNKDFQENWFEKAPGSGSNESERDYWLVKFIFENITQDPEEIKSYFESSPFFKSKDKKHVYKWTYNNNRYFYYLYNIIKGELL